VNKTDHPPLLAAGIHTLTLAEFEQVTVTPFPADAGRRRLFLLFEQWIVKLQALDISATLWVDGSFVTSKHGPNDIDCTMWDPTFRGGQTPERERKAAPLIDRVLLKSQQGLDLYIETPSLGRRLTRESMWRGLYGFQHDRKSAKGFVELTI